MRVPYSWLKEQLAWDGPPEDLAEKLTMAGVEVEEIDEWSDGEADDLVFITSVTANRGDLLSIAGLARHGAATLGTEASPVEIDLPPCGPPASDDIAIGIADPVGCPRYTGILVRGVKMGESPKWMQQRLLAAGMRPINNIVDCTNYVMWELGQPLHAFDAALIAKDADGKAQIIVRRAEAGESFVTLDGGERKLDAGDVVIADPERAIAIAGVMGGANSEVGESTMDVLIESAHFDPVAIRKTAMRLGMSTEASYRFERTVDPEGTLRAARRCAQLMADAAGGEIAEGEVDCHPAPKEPIALTLRPERTDEIIGMPIAPEKQVAYLRDLGMVVDEAADGTLGVVVPTFRPDIEREIDLIEEIAIVHGYENIDGALPGALHESGAYTELQRKRHRLRALLQAAGLSETINVAMIHPGDLDRMGLPADAPERRMLALQRPTDEGLSCLRTTLLPGLLMSAEHNAKQRVSDVALYELDRVFLPVEGEEAPVEPMRLAILMSGSILGNRWNTPAQVGTADFYALKGIVEQALAGMGVAAAWRPETHASFRAGHSAGLVIDGALVGVIGELSQRTQEEFGLAGTTYAAELDADAIVTASTLHRIYRKLPRYPAALRDLAIVVDDTDEGTAARLSEAIAAAGGELLAAVELFDVFADAKRLGEGKRSVAFALEFRAEDRTLTDDEVNGAMERIRVALVDELGAQIRDQ